MPATTTLADALKSLAEESGFGLVIDDGVGATTTITETTTGTSELRGPFTGLKIPVGRPVTVITAGTVGEDSFVSNFSPSTGVLTLLPAVTTAATGFIIWEADIEHGKNAEKAVSRALTNRIGRWELRPLTFVPDGDLQGTTVTDYWTAAANGTAAYVVAQIFPATGAVDAFGQVGVNRLLQLTTSGGSSNVVGNGIRVVESNQMRTWYFRTAIRLVSGTGTATFSIRNNSDSAAAITLQVTRGNDTQTLTTTTLGDFMVCEGTLQLPDNCAEIAPRLDLDATGLVAQMTPLIMYPLGGYSFPLPNRIESDEVIGNFYATRSGGSPSGLADIMLDEPYTIGGITHTLTDYGDHKTVTFNVRPHCPLWYEEYVNGASVSAMTDTTTFSADRIHKWAKYELLNWLMNREALKKAKVNGVPMPSVYRPLRNAALKSARESGYEPQLKQVVGRR